MSAYITKLRRENEQPRSAVETKSSTLRQRLEVWHSSLPPVSRNRAFAISELEQAMGMAGRLLSATIIEAGWTRKRRWQGTAHYFRYWVPPGYRP